jgi:hypothetical protein
MQYKASVGEYRDNTFKRDETVSFHILAYSPINHCPTSFQVI